MQQGGKKREPTLREIMAAQGRITLKPGQQKPAQGKAAPKPGQQKPARQQATPVNKQRTDEEKKRQAAELAKAFDTRTAPNQPKTKEDKLREMVNGDPEKAAEMLRQMFLKGK